jgi:hypothetical protein
MSHGSLAAIETKPHQNWSDGFSISIQKTESPRQLLSEAIRAFETTNGHKAKRLLERLLLIKPTHIDARLLLLSIYQQTNDEHSSRRLIQEAHTLPISTRFFARLETLTVEPQGEPTELSIEVSESQWSQTDTKATTITEVVEEAIATQTQSVDQTDISVETTVQDTLDVEDSISEEVMINTETTNETALETVSPNALSKQTAVMTKESGAETPLKKSSPGISEQIETISQEKSSIDMSGKVGIGYAASSNALAIDNAFSMSDPNAYLLHFVDDVERNGQHIEGLESDFNLSLARELDPAIVASIQLSGEAIHSDTSTGANRTSTRASLGLSKESDTGTHMLEVGSGQITSERGHDVEETWITVGSIVRLNKDSEITLQASQSEKDFSDFAESDQYDSSLTVISGSLKRHPDTNRSASMTLLAAQSRPEHESGTEYVNKDIAGISFDFASKFSNGHRVLYGWRYSEENHKIPESGTTTKREDEIQRSYISYRIPLNTVDNDANPSAQIQYSHNMRKSNLVKYNQDFDAWEVSINWAI